MSQFQNWGHADTALQPKLGSWISSNDMNDLLNPEMDPVTTPPTSSEDPLIQSHQDLYRFQGTSRNQPNDSGRLILFQEVRITPSALAHDIFNGQNIDSIAKAPFWEQLPVREQISPSSHPRSAIQSKDGGQIVDAVAKPRQLMDQDLPKSNQPPTAQDWQTYRNIFTQLYRVENKTLKEVMGIMREQYHFQASARMFKHRIKEWGLSKNYTAAERKDLAQIIKHYERIGERCPKELLIRGQPVQTHRIQRECKKEKSSQIKLSNLHRLKQDLKFTGNSQIKLENFRRHLALSSMPVWPLATPSSQRNTEMLWLQTKVYCESYIQLVISDAVNDDPISSGTFCNKVDTALSSLKLKRGQSKEGWRMLHEASDSVRSLFGSNDKSILRLLLRFAQRWYKSATPALFKVLWTHVSDMASTVLSHNNPITLVCVSIANIGDDIEACETALGLMLSEFEQNLGPAHEKTVEIKFLYQSLLLESGKFDAAELLQRQLLYHYERINEYSHDSVCAVYGLGLVLEKKGNHRGAEEAYRSASLRGSICNGERYPTQNDIYVLHHLVRMLSRRNEFAECEALLERALHMCMENNRDPTDSRMEQILGEQEEIYRQQERIKEAGVEFMDLI